MNPNATSKANILKTSRELIQQNGWAGVNIRSVAAACGVSVGCIYNYFASKTELLRIPSPHHSNKVSIFHPVS